MLPSNSTKRIEPRLDTYDGDAEKYSRWSKKARMLIMNMDRDWLNAIDLTREEHEAEARKSAFIVSGMAGKGFGFEKNIKKQVSLQTASGSTSSTTTSKSFDSSHDDEQDGQTSPPPKSLKVEIDTDAESKALTAVHEGRRKVALLLCCALKDEAIDLIADEDTSDPRTIWVLLRDAAKGVTLGARAGRFKKLWSKKFEDHHSAQFIVTQMKSLLDGLNVEDDEKIGALQQALPNRLSGFCDIIDTMLHPSYAEVTRILLSKDSTFSNRSGKNQKKAESVFGAFTGGGGGGGGGGFNGRGGKPQGRGGGGEKKKKKKKACFNCDASDHFIAACQVPCKFPGHQGHLPKDCRERQSKRGAGGNRSVHFASQSAVPEVEFKWGLLAANDSLLRDSSGPIVDFWDSGAGVHLVCAREKVNKIRPLPPIVVSGALGGELVLTKGGDVTKVLLDHLGVPRKYEFKNCYLNPALRSVNLFSQVVLDDIGIRSQTDTGKVALSTNPVGVKFNEGIFATGVKGPGRLFKLRTVPDVDGKNVLFAVPKKKPESKVKMPYALFHWRCAHLGKDRVMKTAETFGVDLQRAEEEKVCDPCRRGKAVSQPFRSSAQIKRALAPGEVVHLDVIVLQHATHDQKKYVALFTDCATDLKRMAEMRLKSELYEVFLAYMRWSERQTGVKLKSVRMDGELYASTQFKELRVKEGFAVKLTCRGKSSMNPVAERSNRSIETMARVMMLDGRVPPYLTGKAMKAACYIHNHLWSDRANGPPLAKFLGKSTTLHQLRRMFCRCWYKPANRPMGKVDERGMMGVMCGYDEDRRAWLVFDLAAKKFVSSRDVSFDEYTRGWPKGWSERRQAEGLTHYPELFEEPSPAPLPHVIVDEGDEEAPTSIDQRREADDSPEVISPSLPAVSPSMPHLEPATPVDAVRDSKAIDLEEKHPPADLLMEDLSEAAMENPIRRYPARERVQSLAGVESAISRNAVFAVSVAIPAKRALQIPKWKQAMDKHMAQVMSKRVYDIVPRSAVGKDGNIISSRWVFSEENQAAQDGAQKDVWKARWVVRGFSQMRYIDYWDTWSPTIRLCSTRFLFCLAARCGFTVRHVDVRAAFYNAILKEAIFAELPEGYREEGKVAKLNKAVPGLKQAGREWYLTLNGILVDSGWLRTDYDPSFYVKWAGGEFAVLGVHVDDCLCAGSVAAGDAFVSLLAANFEVKDLGEAKFALGMNVVRFRDGYGLHMASYIETMLARFGMSDCHPVATPGLKEKPSDNDKCSGLKKFSLDELKGSLRWPTICVRPDTAADMCLLSKSVNPDPDLAYARSARVCRYYKGTPFYGLRFYLVKGPIFPLDFDSWVDANLAGCVFTGRSQGGHFIALGRQIFDFQCKRQDVVSTSSCESELREFKDVLRKLRWLLSLCEQLRMKVRVPIPVKEDNTGAIQLATTNVLSKKMGHVEISMRYVNEQMSTGDFVAVKVSTKDQVADILTKSLVAPIFLKHRSQVVTEIKEQPLTGSVALAFCQPFGKCGDGPLFVGLVPGPPDGSCHAVAVSGDQCRHNALPRSLLCALHQKMSEGKHCRGRTPRRQCKSVAVDETGFCRHHRHQAPPPLALRVPERVVERPVVQSSPVAQRAPERKAEERPAVPRPPGEGDLYVRGHAARRLHDSPDFNSSFPSVTSDGKRGLVAREATTPVQSPAAVKAEESPCSSSRSTSSTSSSSTSTSSSVRSGALQPISTRELFAALAELFMRASISKD